MTYGVIGNTAVFGSVIQGSSPCRSTKGSLTTPFFYIHILIINTLCILYIGLAKLRFNVV